MIPRFRLSVGIVAVNDKFRISPAAQFVEVHADALAVGVDAEGDYAVEEPEEQIDERQDQAKEGCNAYQLGDELACLTGEEARGNESPKAADGVNGDGAGGIVDGDGEFEDFNEKGRCDAGDEADEDRVKRCDQSGAAAGGDQAGEISVGAEAGVWLAEADV